MDIEVIIEGHEQRIKTLERDMSAMKEVQAEIRSMNETLVTLANELKHTNEHLARHERKIDEIDAVPKQRMQQIITAIIAALSGGIISTINNCVFEAYKKLKRERLGRDIKISTVTDFSKSNFTYKCYTGIGCLNMLYLLVQQVLEGTNEKLTAHKVIRAVKKLTEHRKIIIKTMRYVY